MQITTDRVLWFIEVGSAIFWALAVVVAAGYLIGHILF